MAVCEFEKNDEIQVGILKYLWNLYLFINARRLWLFSVPKSLKLKQSCDNEDLSEFDEEKESANCCTSLDSSPLWLRFSFFSWGRDCKKIINY